VGSVASPGLAPLLGALLLAAVAAGCGGGGGGEPSAAAGPAASPTAPPGTGAPPTPEPSSYPPAPTTAPTTGSGGAGPAGGPSPAPPAGDARFEAARQDLARRFGYDPAEVRLVGVEPVTWRDGALGCPSVDGTYEPGPVEGYRMEVAWEDVTFRYHGAAGEPPFLCQYLD